MELHSKALQCCLSTTLFLLISLDRLNSETLEILNYMQQVFLRLYGYYSSEWWQQRKARSPGIHCLCYPSRNTSNTKKCNNLYLYKPAVTIGPQNLILSFSVFSSSFPISVWPLFCSQLYPDFSLCCTSLCSVSHSITEHHLNLFHFTW